MQAEADNGALASQKTGQNDASISPHTYRIYVAHLARGQSYAIHVPMMSNPCHAYVYWPIITLHVSCACVWSPSPGEAQDMAQLCKRGAMLMLILMLMEHGMEYLAIIGE